MRLSRQALRLTASPLSKATQVVDIGMKHHFMPMQFVQNAVVGRQYLLPLANFPSFVSGGAHKSFHSSEKTCVLASFVRSQGTKNGTVASSNESNSKQNEDQNGEEVVEGSVEDSELVRRLEALEKKNSEIEDKYKRSIAEMENMRVRLMKQIEEAKIFGIQSFCKDLLEVADVLNKAVEATKQDAANNPEMLRGLELTESQLYQVFRRHGLSQISPKVGEDKFDPMIHEALFQIPAPDKNPNTVMDVQKVGYSLHGRTIRAALVGVSKN